MRDGDKKRPKRSAGWWNFGVAVIGVVSASGFAIWGLAHPAGSTQNNIQTTYNNIQNSFNRAADGSTISNNGSITKNVPVASPVPGTDASEPDVPMSTLSQDSGIQMAYTKYARTIPNQNNEVNVFLRVTSSGAAWKVFAPNNLPGWTLSTQSGKHCNLFNNIYGLLHFDVGSYQNHIREMQTILPGAVLKANILGVCDQPIEPNDKFDLSAQLDTLPGAAVSGSPESQNLSTVNFSSGNNPIALE